MCNDALGHSWLTIFSGMISQENVFAEGFIQEDVYIERCHACGKTQIKPYTYTNPKSVGGHILRGWEESYDWLYRGN